MANNIEKISNSIEKIIFQFNKEDKRGIKNLKKRLEVLETIQYDLYKHGFSLKLGNTKDLYSDNFYSSIKE